MPKKIAVAAVAALALAAAGVAAAAAVTHPQSFRTLASHSSANRVTLHATKVGKALATSAGMTLYLFKKDAHGTSACYGQCATYWPPLLVTSKPASGAGVRSALLGMTKRKNGTHQVTYAGHPLYRFKLDKGAGQIKGQGQAFFGGKWYAVSSSGAAITKAAPTSTTTTSTTTTGSTSTCPAYGC